MGGTPRDAMTPVCFRLRVRPDLVPAYRERHAAVWPDMLAALAETGWHDYRIFVADDGLCIGTFRTPDLGAALTGMAAREVNARWQAEMGELFEDSGQAPDEGFMELEEVFHLEDQLAAANTSTETK